MGSSRRIEQPRFDVRLSVNIPVSVRLYGRPATAMIMADVSAAGAMLAGETHDLVKGDEIVLAIVDAMAVVATIVWVNANSLGLTFHKRLSGSDLDEVLTIGRHSSQLSDGDHPSRSARLPFPSRYSGLI